MMKKIIFSIGVIALLLMVGCQSNEEPIEQLAKDEAISNEGGDDKVPNLPEVELQKGDIANDVTDLQYHLHKIGYPIELTGEFDALTTWAITDLQMQTGEDYITGIYTLRTMDIIQKVISKEVDITPGDKLKQPEHPEQLTDVIENPYDILALVNKTYALPHDYLPEDLVVPDVQFPFTENDPKKQLRQVAADALEDMFHASIDDGIELFAQSGFRSYDRQDAIFAANVDRHGEEKANTYSARPGESEHQTGLVMDVTAQSVDFQLIIDFEDTKEGQWIKKHAPDYGFIIRYPKGKEAITKYQYEPWHLRYVGQKAAQTISENNLTLEEYLDKN